MTRHDPQRSTTDDGVLRRTGNRLPVRKRTHFEIKLCFRTDTGITGRALGKECALAGAEVGTTFVTTAGVDEFAVLCPLGHLRQMCHLRLAIQHQLGVETGKTVILRGERHVVIGGEVLEMNPALPCCHQRAILATSLQLCQDIVHLLPGRHIRVRINTGRAHRVTVHPQNRCRRVEWQRQHLAFGRCVIAFDRADIGI